MASLHFQSINPTAPRTLLLLHGAFSSHHEWEPVVSTGHLSSYHLLIPDLPSHGRSTSSLIPLQSLPDTAALLADLIVAHAQGGKASIVGMSLGGYLALAVASMYPDVVSARPEGGIFVSGCGRAWPGPGSAMTRVTGMVMFLSAWTSTHLTRGFMQWVSMQFGLALGDELFEDMKAASSWGNGQRVAELLAEDQLEEGRNWKGSSERIGVRTLVVAGALDDDGKDTKLRGEQLKRGNAESRSFKVEGMRHAWNLQNPDLFARGIKAWIERKELPEEYISI